MPESKPSSSQQQQQQKSKASCDLCYMRKVKCVRDTPGIEGTSSSAPAPGIDGGEDNRCNGCKDLGRECTYQRVKRRPGRPNAFAAPSGTAPRTSTSSTSNKPSSNSPGLSTTSMPAPSTHTHNSHTSSHPHPYLPGHSNSFSSSTSNSNSNSNSNSLRGIGGLYETHPVPTGVNVNRLPSSSTSPNFDYLTGLTGSTPNSNSNGNNGNGLGIGSIGSSNNNNGGGGGGGPSNGPGTLSFARDNGVPTGPGTGSSQDISPSFLSQLSSSGGGGGGGRGDMDYSTSTSHLPFQGPSPSFSDPSGSVSVGNNNGNGMNNSSNSNGNGNGLNNILDSSPWNRQSHSAGGGGGGGLGDNGNSSLSSLLNQSSNNQVSPIAQSLSAAGIGNHGQLSNLGGGGGGGGSSSSMTTMPARPQIEDITSFNNIFFFISLYLRHLHSHTPVVHKPTFAQSLATRLDQRDEEFRALLLSMTSYVISQSPKSRMISLYTQSELERLQSRCYEASQVLQARRYKKPSLVHLATLMSDYFFCCSTGKTNKASATVAEAVALAYQMGIHDESRMANIGMDHIQRQLSRRAFWHLYAMNWTEASAGMPSFMHDLEGTCPYPAEVDDDFITSQGIFIQPPERVSFMTGFVVVTKLFRIMAECITRHRMMKNQPYGFDPMQTDRAWIEGAHARVREILDEVPAVLSSAEPMRDGVSLDQDANAIFGMQRANLLITAASIRFALYDLRQLLEADSAEVASEQERVSQETYKLLSSIPLDALAANGESMRGKVLRIICALVNRSGTPDQWSESVKDWWDMFTMVQFVQVVPLNLESLMPSRAGTPNREM